MRFVRWLFRDAFQAEYNAGYRAAVDRILLLPEKVRLGDTLGLNGGELIDNCSFVGGSPAIRFEPNAYGTHIERSIFTRADIAIEFASPV